MVLMNSLEFTSLFWSRIDCDGCDVFMEMAPALDIDEALDTMGWVQDGQGAFLCSHCNVPEV